MKTPGACVKRDASALVCRAVLDADLLIAASPVVMGYTTALLKRALDQMIPLVHPYLIIEGGEMHHRPRYGVYPKFALLLGAGPGTDAEDLDIIRALWSRTARNLKLRSIAAEVDSRPFQEVADAIVAAA